MAGTQTKKEQVEEPSDFDGYVSKFQEDQAKETAKSQVPSEDSEAKEKESDESQETKESKENAEEICTTCGDKNKEEKEPETKEDEKTPLYKIVNEKGEQVPFVVKADGKEHSIDDIEKMRKYLEHGIHASQKLEEANKLIGSNQQKEQELESVIQEVQKLMDFYQKKEKPSGESESDDEDSLDDILDPDIKALKKELHTLRKEYEDKIKTQEDTLKKITLSVLGDGLQKDMEKALEKYPSLKIIPRKEEKILLLMNKKDKNGDFVHKGLDAAAKAVNDEWEQGFQNYIKEHPEYQKKSKGEAVQDYLEKKQEKEQAPISSPSEKLATTESSSKNEKEEFTGVDDAMSKFNKWLKGANSKAKKT